MDKKNTRLLIGGIIVVGLLGISIWMFALSTTPYTRDFQTAMSGERVQVWGEIDKSSLVGNEFTLIGETGEKLPIILLEQIPTNIDHADSCVVTGAWNNNIFEAESILLKCPSKYEEAE